MKNDEIQKLKDTLWANTWSNKEIIEEGIATLKQAFEYRQEASGLLAIYTLQQENKQLKQRDEFIAEAINKLGRYADEMTNNGNAYAICVDLLDKLKKYKGDNK